MNTWWRAKEVPAELTGATVVRVHKQGSTAEFRNYRQISLLSTLYHVCTAVLQRMMDTEVEDKVPGAPEGEEEPRKPYIVLGES